MTQLSTQTVEALRSTVDAACMDQETGIPGTVVVVVGKDGNELFTHAAGKRGILSKDPMTTDNIFWIASCTKMIVGIACMQLVETGKISLDDANQLESLCPELKDVKVLQNDGTLVPKKHPITLRMLLTHTGDPSTSDGIDDFTYLNTAGFAYTFFNERVRDYSFPVGYDEFAGNIKDVMQPLIHQPGEGWEYGVNVDWAGIAVERSTGMSLNDYLHKHIFEPLGLKNISMIPTKAMKEKLAYMHHRNSDGSLIGRDHLLRRPLVVETPDEIRTCFNSGGAGCFSQPSDYCRK